MSVIFKLVIPDYNSYPVLSCLPIICSKEQSTRRTMLYASSQQLNTAGQD